MKQHPCTVGLFRDMDEIEFRALVTDIKAHGLRQPLVLFEEMILDGWNRYRACKQLRIEPSTTQFKGPGSPLDYAVSVNLERRHLDTADRAMVGLSLIPRYAAEAVVREKSGLKRGADAPLGPRDPSGSEGRTAEHVARVVGLSEQTMKRAKFVQDHAPELLTDATLPTINEKYNVAQRAEREQKQAQATRAMPRAEREAREESDRVRTILAGVRQMNTHLNAALDKGGELVGLGSKDIEPVLKDLRAAAGKLRALQAKKDKAA